MGAPPWRSFGTSNPSPHASRDRRPFRLRADYVGAPSQGPSVWYTDPYRRNGQREPFAGSVRQVIARINTALDPHGPTIERERWYGGLGVRAPN